MKVVDAIRAYYLKASKIIIDHKQSSSKEENFSEITSQSLFDLHEQAYKEITAQRVRNRFFIAEQMAKPNEHRVERNSIRERLFCELTQRAVECSAPDLEKKKPCHNNDTEQLLDYFNTQEVLDEARFHLLKRQNEEAIVREVEEISRRMALEVQLLPQIKGDS